MKNNVIRNITAVIAVIWLLVLVGMAALASRAPSETNFPQAGALENAVAGVDEAGLNMTTIVPADVYGDEWIAGGLLCEGMKTADIEEYYGADLSALELSGEEIPAGTNYMMLVGADGTTAYDAIPTDSLNLCPVPLAGYIQMNSMMPLVKGEEGGWALAV